ncbi:MAG: murein biosynthesis integral membrane protein MurJ [Nitrospirae bacterium]|nr:murein biosynthesis integral membrane protein MurJ [Nitrospirota bacterium]MBI5696242.1 murein biosynthesis integral membrane protein MurJ [Nitrospirota bacterium]
MSDQANITKAAWSMSGVTSISRVLGFVRVMVIAKVFGAGMVADCFFVAFRISNILRELLAEGSMSAAFIPVFSEYLHTKSKEEARELASAVFSILLFILIGVVMLGIALSPQIVSAIAHGYVQYPEKFGLTVDLTRVMFPYILFVGLSAVTMGVLNSMGSFAAPAFAPVMLNISMIGFALYVSPTMENPIAGLAMGVVFGGLLQLLIQLPALNRKGMGFRFIFRPRHEGVKKVGRLTIPVIGSQAVTQINIFISSIIATYLPEGSVSYLFYAMYLFQFPHGIFGVSIAQAVLPSMSKQAAIGDDAALRDTFSFGMRNIFFAMVPAMIGLIVLRVPIVSLLMQRGTFTYADTLGTAYALLFFSIGLWAYSGVRVVNAAFYSLQDTRTPVMGAALSMVTNVCMSLLLMGPLRHGGLALATALAAMLNMSFLLYMFRRRMGLIGGRRIIVSVVKTLVAASVMGVVCYYIAGTNAVWAEIGHVLEKSYLLTAAIVAGIAVYASMQYMMKSEELSFMYGMVAGRIKRRRG